MTSSEKKYQLFETQHIGREPYYTQNKVTYNWICHIQSWLEYLAMFNSHKIFFSLACLAFFREKRRICPLTYALNASNRIHVLSDVYLRQDNLMP